MKIGILTVPFNNNYGGFLQAYALKTVIKNTGNEVIFIRRERPRKLWWDIISIIKWLIGKGDYVFFREYKKRKASKFTDAFQHRYLYPMTESFYRPITYQSIKKYGIDKFIVGSDQVWRYQYAQSSIFNYFFDFLQGTNIPRMSYAASFGGNNEDFPKELFIRATKLLEEFDIITVREQQATNILRVANNNINKSKVVLDPTFLLDKDEYVSLLSNNIKTSIPQKGLFSYLLDKDSIKTRIQTTVSEKLSIRVVEFEAMDPTLKKIEPVKSVEDWLFGIERADFIITDSFHGTVFSIIFNRPFITIGNKQRGLERLKSVLNLFGLEDRMLLDYSEESVLTILNTKIDWENINKILKFNRMKSLKILIDWIQNI